MGRKHELTQREYAGPVAVTDNRSGYFAGGRWNIFRHIVEQRIEKGEILNRYQWRAHIALSDGRKIWKGDSERRIVELWLKDKILELTDHTKITFKEQKRKD